jgi:hypothetical protein
VTILQNSNAGTSTPTPAAAAANVGPPRGDEARGLPSAGSEGPGIEWWRWGFFLAALLFGVAGWFFTFAMHNSGKEVVLLDRFDRRRRR